MGNGLAKQIRDLQVRAGNPPVRELERLIKALRPQHSIARSTIQEKISGKTPAKLTQILAIIDAIAEYGRINGTPLAAQEVDENTWRAKYVSAMGNRGRTGRAPTPQDETATPQRIWDPKPLRATGMTDLVDLIAQSEGAPLVSWVPHVAAEMNKAGMSCESLMKWVSSGGVRDTIDCIQALDRIFPLPDPDKEPHFWDNNSSGYAAVTEYALIHTARIHGIISAPKIIAGLRRANVGQYVRAFLRFVACWHLPKNIDVAVKRLRAAELGNDAGIMLGYIGSDRREDRVVEVVHHFLQEKDDTDAATILKGMSEESPQRFTLALRDPKCATLSNALISGVPWNKGADYVAHLRDEGFGEIADKITVPGNGYSDEPPF
ncbi:hypothetical protein [Streptomyces sp. NPDC051561]|uniref:hypothetical protein n=1 Tax=Streptomyces sp. NPDC051561 TaxID=3365658 RepID=UPI00378DA622